MKELGKKKKLTAVNLTTVTIALNLNEQSTPFKEEIFSLD